MDKRIITCDYITNDDIILFIKFLEERFNYNFHIYSKATLKLRLRIILNKYNLKNIDELISFTGKNKINAERIIYDFTVTYREFFRDPVFLRQFRKRVDIFTKPLQEIRIWIPECGNGIEAYTFAIILHETEAYRNSAIIATDSNDVLIEKAKAGIYPSFKWKKDYQNYEDSGGKLELSELLPVKNDIIEVNRKLREKISFSKHSILSENIPGQFNLIFFRNSLIYFEYPAQISILQKLSKCLFSKGVLCLGEKETFHSFPGSENFKSLVKNERIYQKLR
ncbi:MAG: hypothetical protein HY738_22860 [Bacteroidia bacterium]|nr:hypothetical protein [Bacteroidia bacterium]